MGCAEVLSFDEVRARKHWTTLRQRLHERFDRWLDHVESKLPEGEPTLGQVREIIWTLRQQLTGGIAETIVQYTHQEAQSRQHMPCPTCARLLTARGPVSRRVETMVGVVELARPDFYCQVCCEGTSPLDDVLRLSAGRLQLDVPQAVAAVVTALPYATAATMRDHLSGIAVRSERRHTLTHQVRGPHRVGRGTLL